MTPPARGAFGLLLAALSLLRGVRGSDEATCTAHDDAACHGTAADDMEVRSRAPAPPRAMADLIEQEVEALEQYVSLCESRISMLEDLRSVVDAGFNTSIPDPHLRVLKEKLPLLSGISFDSDTAPISSERDFLLTKAIIREREGFASIEFLPLRGSSSPSTSSSTAAASSAAAAVPSALLVATRADGTVRLFTPSGEPVLSLETGHERQVSHLAVSPSHDEHLIATGDVAGVVRLHQIVVRARRFPTMSDETQAGKDDPAEQRASQFLGGQLNVSAKFQVELSIRSAANDGEMAQLTAVTFAQHQQSKFYVLGDAKGTVSVFAKNGTLKTQIDATTTPGVGIEGFYHQFGSLLFRAGSEWGYIDLEKLEVRHLDCPSFEGHVKSAIIDSQHASRLFVADERGGVWAFNVRNKKECKVEHRFRNGSTRSNVVDLASVRGFVLGIEGPDPSAAGAGWSVVALNMSHVGRRKQEAMLLPSPVVWRRSVAPLRSWAVQRRQQQGDLLAFLSEDGRELEVAELLMAVYTPPEEDSYGDFKLPMLAVLVVLVLGYQYMKQKGKLGGSSKKRDLDMDYFKKSAAAGKLAGLKNKGNFGKDTDKAAMSKSELDKQNSPF